jgi:lipopolysaccharide biosynthesis protein
MKTEARLIAFYLPQYHPIPENDEWWGKGFTEWTNVAKAKPLFPGHYQPRLPADLGYYDLRVPEVREAQAELARNAGIEGFCYYHYWFGGGKRLLERPFNEVVASGKPDFPFCLCWANQTWTGIWHGAPGRTLIEQTYPGIQDYRKHFSSLRDAFLDPRYMRSNGRPIFVIYRPTELPNPIQFISEWQELAVHNGLPGFHFVAHLTSDQLGWDYTSGGFDSCVVVNTHKVFGVPLRHRLFGTNENGLHGNLGQSWTKKDTLWHSAWRRYRSSLGQFSNVRLYREAVPFLLEGCAEQEGTYPCVIPNWDNTPRSHRRGYVLHDSTPELFRIHLQDALSLVRSRPVEDRLVFIKSWNEWAEGNYLEPDRRFGHDYLKVVNQVVSTETLEHRSAVLTTFTDARLATR